MSVNAVNYLNLILIIVSFVVAYIVPFELFVITYALIGPLHYLTELPWLHKNNYFVNKPKFAWWLLVLALVFAVMFLLTKNHHAFAAGTFLAFGSALSLVVTSSTKYRVLIIFGFGLLIAPLLYCDPIVFFFGTFFTSLVHVCIFTLLFMIYGVIKEKNISGLLMIVVYVSLAIYLLTSSASAQNYRVTYYIAFNNHEFGDLQIYLAKVLGWKPSWDNHVSAMRFIAFAYTYHYLNWFSKTSIIKWHKIDVKTVSVILVVYFISVGIYCYDYVLGLNILLLLSLSHVYLEFPLNWICLNVIRQETVSYFSPKTS